MNEFGVFKAEVFDKIKRSISEYDSNINVDINEDKLLIPNTGHALYISDDFAEEYGSVASCHGKVVEFHNKFCCVAFSSTKIDTEDRIIVSGIINGELRASKEFYAAICLNISEIFDVKKFLDGDGEVELSHCLNDNFMICEIVKNDVSENLFKHKIDDFFVFLATTCSYKYEVLLSFNKIQATKTINIGNGKSIDYPNILDYQPYYYFLQGEVLNENSNKFLAYYHVMEYFFYFVHKDELKNKIDDLVSCRMLGKNENYERKVEEVLSYFFNEESAPTKKKESNLAICYVII